MLHGKKQQRLKNWEALRITLTHLTRRNFFRSTLGLIAGILLPKSLQGTISDIVLLPYAATPDEVEIFHATGKFVLPMKEWKCITVVGGGTRRPQGCHPRIWRNIKEGLSKSRAHGTTYRSWVRWPANKPCTVTIGKQSEEE